MAHIHCLISLGKGKEWNAGSISDLPLVCDPGIIKCKDLSLEFSRSFPMLKIYEANYFLGIIFLPFNKIFILTLYVD